MIKINNVYYMLAYSYKALHEKDKKLYKEEEFPNIYDLFAEMMTNIINKQIKRGLNKDYVTYQDELSNIRGRINITESIKRVSMLRHQMVCEYDEYSINSYFNQIAKTAALYLIKSNKIVNEERKNRLKRTLYYFNDIEEIKNIHNINWSSLKFNKNNESYRLLMEISRLILKKLYIGSGSGNLEFSEYLEDKAMASLYESFVREYYISNFKDLTIGSKSIYWNKDKENYFGLLSRIPKMRTDITIEDKASNKTLIIDTKFYLEIFKDFYDREKFAANNLYQIYSYIRNADTERKGNVSGMLLYAKTGNESIGWNRFIIDGNIIVITDLDLNTSFDKIEEKLCDIIDWYHNKIDDQYMSEKYG